MTPPVEELRAVVYHCIRQWKTHREWEDLFSEALIHAWEQVHNMPPDSPYRWTTIAGKAAQYQAVEYLRSGRSGNLRYRHFDGQLLACEVDWPRGYEIPDDGGIPEADERLQKWLNRQRYDPVLAGLSERHRRIFQAYQSGKKQQEIADAEGITWSRVWQIVEAVRDRYRDLHQCPKERVTHCWRCRKPLGDVNPRRKYCSARCKNRAQELKRQARGRGSLR